MVFHRMLGPKIQCFQVALKWPVRNVLGRCFPVFLALFVLLASCQGDESMSYQPSLMLYSDSAEEREYIEQYPFLYPNASIQLDLFEFKESYDTQIQLLFETQQLPDLFSVWNSRAYRPMLESSDLLDMRGFMPLKDYHSDVMRSKYKYGPLRMLPVRYNYSNVMLVNMELLPSLKSFVNLDDLRHYQNLIDLAEIAKEKRMNFLVIGDPDTTSTSDLFFSPIVGWADSYWFSSQENGNIESFSPQIVTSIQHFYSHFHDLFPDPYLAQLSREEAERMFLNGQVLMIIGTTEQLSALAQKASMPVRWKAFPSVLPRIEKTQSAEWLASKFGEEDQVEALRLSKLGKTGAMLGDVLGVAIASRVLGYDMYQVREVIGPIQYYNGLNSREQRVLNWGVPVPSLFVYKMNFPNDDPVFKDMMNLHSSIDYEYQRASMYLSGEWMQFLNESIWAFLSDDSWRFLEPAKRASLFVQNLQDFALAQNQQAPPPIEFEEETSEEE